MHRSGLLGDYLDLMGIQRSKLMTSLSKTIVFGLMWLRMSVQWSVKWDRLSVGWIIRWPALISASVAWRINPCDKNILKHSSHIITPLPIKPKIIKSPTSKILLARRYSKRASSSGFVGCTTPDLQLAILLARSYPPNFSIKFTYLSPHLTAQ